MATLGPPEDPFGARFRTRLSGPSLLATLAVVPLFWLGREEKLIADVSIWTLLVMLVGAQVLTALAYARWPGSATGWKLYARVGTQLLFIGAIIYTIGWGPTLAIGFLVGVADNIQFSGSKAARPAIVWSIVAIALGECAIAAGIAPSLVHEPLVHGLAALAAVGVAYTIAMLGWSTARREVAERELRESESRFRALVQQQSDIIMVIGSDGLLRYVSPAFERVLGYRAADVVGQRGLDIAHPDDVEGARQAVVAVLEGHDVGRTEARLRHKDGEWLWFDVSTMNMLDEPGVGGFVSNLRDMSERKRNENVLREAEERFRSAFEHAPIGMGLADEGGQLFRVNRAMADMLGYEPEALLGLRIRDITYPDDWSTSEREMQRMFAGEIEGYRMEKRYVHADGRVLWGEVSVSLVRSPDGDPLYQVGQIVDITERKAIAERLAHAAIHDPLTGLPNRVLLVDRLEHALHQAQRRQSKVGVIFLDLDRFKLVNDRLGHAAGDELLRVLSERLRNAVRPGDTVARFGGDEFVIVCDDVAYEREVVDVAERIAEMIARPATIVAREVFVTASLGIVITRRAGHSAGELLRDADAAMYRAKDQGRARIELFDEGAHRLAVSNLETGADLHRALERSEFRVHYQPIVDLEVGLVRGLEALVRWQHPTRGLLNPDDFIGLAEDAGLIVPLGKWVLEEACKQTVRWQESQRRQENFGVSVNLSPRQLADPSLPEDLERILHVTGIDPGMVWLELTEGALMHDVDAAVRALEALTAQGVRLAVDDFGTGYSSLAHLKRFPVELLKVDQTFVDGLGRDPEDTSIVGAVVSLAHSLGLSAIAEGLETPLQLAELRTMGCDYAQGFLFGAPKSAEAIGDHPADDLSPWHDATTG
jgi:diguanylate cyclase (GGDEF)-like protein/PAS domain S-box-containing protein